MVNSILVTSNSWDYSTVMRTIKEHGWVFLIFLVTTFVAFGWLVDTPLWNLTDIQIISDAHDLAAAPLAMFRHVGFYFSQPLLQLAFLLEYYAFGINPLGYQTVNLVLHALNAFVVYMLVHMLFPQRPRAILAGLLFALGVGSYGKVLMGIHQLEPLLMAGQHLLVLYFFIRNDFRRDGSIRSPLFLLGLGLFLLTGLTRNASFAVVLTLIAYKAFFYKWRRGRAILSKDLFVFGLVGVLFYLGQSQWGYRHPTIVSMDPSDSHFTLMSVKNLFRYLVLMFFPLQQSPILEEASPLVVFLYEARTIIRIALTLAIISYSFFGFVFGSRAVRFFIACTYITLLPFTDMTSTGQWLNLTHLYLTSVGFCVILAAGTQSCSKLLARAGWRRFLPYLVPLAFIGSSLFLAHTLDAEHRHRAESPEIVIQRAKLSARDDEQPAPRHQTILQQITKNQTP